jgi:hypothetical protein
VRRILDVRIVRWELKLVFVVGAIVAGFAIAWLLRTLGAMEVSVLIITFFFDLAAILLGARVFRGRGEAIEPPRAWWRMTARPPLSRRLGILFVVQSALGAASLVLEATGVYAPLPPLTGDDVVIYSSGILEGGAIAYLYLNSAARLKRLGVPYKAPKPPQEPKFRPPVKLKP